MTNECTNHSILVAISLFQFGWNKMCLLWVELGASHMERWQGEWRVWKTCYSFNDNSSILDQICTLFISHFLLIQMSFGSRSFIARFIWCIMYAIERKNFHLCFCCACAHACACEAKYVSLLVFIAVNSILLPFGCS